MMKFSHFIFGFGLSVVGSANGQAMTLKTNEFASIIKSKESFDEVCKITQGTKVSLLSDNSGENFMPIQVETGPCSGKKGFISIEFLSMEEKKGPSLSRSTPILKNPNGFEQTCFAVQNTPIEIQSNDKNALIAKIRILDGLCKGMTGWVYRESIKI